MEVFLHFTSCDGEEDDSMEVKLRRDFCVSFNLKKDFCILSLLLSTVVQEARLKRDGCRER